MKLTILGCWGGFPPAGGATSGYLVETHSGNVLVDCGSGVLSQLFFHKPPFQIDAVILSHLHHDHVADLPVLQYALRSSMRRGFEVHLPLPLYLPEHSPPSFWEALQPEFQVMPVRHHAPYDILGAVVTFAPTTHPVECNAIRIEENGKTLVYSGDSSPDMQIAELAKEADLFLCESTMVPQSVHSSGKGHMGPADAARLAQVAAVKQLILTHLPSDGDLLFAREIARGIYSGPVELASVRSVYVAGEET